MFGRCKDGIEVAPLPANHHAVDNFADQAPRYAKDAGRLEALERSSDGLTAEARCGLQHGIGWRAIAVRAAYEAQDQGAKDSQADLAHDAVAGSSGPRAAFQGFGKDEDAGSLISIERPAVVARVNKPRAAAKVVSHG
jgi:hypothetical protein